ncbi:hypothetical protein NGRA_2919 [Nosema granulosis]|uniref:Uncharacterized protein n=1 Tax=Nosema granulosis TaxID=83296 RepID=A0A9P6GVR9_9MICR|nr:hypothetical protein NGRA_2919 [Nosema granulosis]
MKKKFDIFEHLNIKTKPINTSNTEISLALESSTVLKSTKYITRKTNLEINFLKYSPLDKVKLFFITVTKQLSRNKWSGFDSTCRCILNSEINFVPLKRYEIYGRLKKNKYLEVDVLRGTIMNYEELIYQVI